MSGATFARLRSGEWGVRVPGDAHEGQVLTVSKRDGSTSTVTVTKVVYRGAGECLCAIEQKKKPAGGRGYGQRSGGRCRMCRGPIRDVPEHRAMGGLCGSCAFDEYDC